VAPSLLIARHQWEAGLRRVDELRADAPALARAYRNIDLLTDELRRRVGRTFTLEQLADAYDRSEDWAREVLEERGAPGWPAQLTLVLDAAFGLYARGAIDYAP
jgi:hypothetical protein